MRYFLIVLTVLGICCTGCVHLSPVVSTDISGPGFPKPLSECTLLVGEFVNRFQPTGFAFGTDSAFGRAGDATAYGSGTRMGITGERRMVWEAPTWLVIGCQKLGVFKEIITSEKGNWEIRIRVDWRSSKLKERWPWYACLHVPVFIVSCFLFPPYPIFPVEVLASCTITFWDREGRLLRAYRVNVKDRWLLNSVVYLDVSFGEDERYREQAEAEAFKSCFYLMKEDIRKVAGHK